MWRDSTKGSSNLNSAEENEERREHLFCYWQMLHTCGFIHTAGSRFLHACCISSIWSSLSFVYGPSLGTHTFMPKDISSPLHHVHTWLVVWSFGLSTFVFKAKPWTSSSSCSSYLVNFSLLSWKLLLEIQLQSEMKVKLKSVYWCKWILYLCSKYTFTLSRLHPNVAYWMRLSGCAFHSFQAAWLLRNSGTL